MAETAQERVTVILQEARDVDHVSGELLPLVYNELRRLAAQQMAKETPGNTLEPTALVHEAYIRLVGDADIRWESRAHFFASAARSMRQILINRAVRKQAERHGGDRKRHEFDEAFFASEPAAERLIALDEALNQLEEIDARKGKIVMLRYFAGLTIDETAKALDISPRTVTRDWRFAITWLQREMNS